MGAAVRKVPVQEDPASILQALVAAGRGFGCSFRSPQSFASKRRRSCEFLHGTHMMKGNSKKVHLGLLEVELTRMRRMEVVGPSPLDLGGLRLSRWLAEACWGGRWTVSVWNNEGAQAVYNVLHSEFWNAFPSFLIQHAVPSFNVLDVDTTFLILRKYSLE